MIPNLSNLSEKLQEGVLYFSALTSDVATIQICLNLLLILMICWVYGRERFQSDLKFMVGQQLATFRIHILRFLVPLCFLLIIVRQQISLTHSNPVRARNCESLLYVSVDVPDHLIVRALSK